jgi:two-component system response regulator
LTCPQGLGRWIVGLRAREIRLRDFVLPTRVERGADLEDVVMSRVMLLVANDALERRLVLDALKDSSIHEVVVEAAGAAALDYLFATGRHAGRDATVMPAVVVVDLDAPTEGSAEAVRRMRADGRTRLIPVILLSASTRPEDIAAGYALGANAYVAKPADVAAFAEVARALAVFWLSLNEAAPTRLGS